MKKALLAMAVIAGLVLFGYLVYIVGFIYAYRNFAGPSRGNNMGDAPKLLQYVTAGRLERLENAIIHTIHNSPSNFEYIAGSVDQFPTVAIRHNGDEFSYRLHLDDCHDLFLLDEYEQVASCGTATLTILSIAKNGIIVYDNYHRTKPTAKRLRAYKQIFEDVFYDSVQSALIKQPAYDWKITRKTVNDTPLVLLDIYQSPDSNAIRTRHVFVQQLGNNNYRELRTEKYLGDSSVIIQYDPATGNQTGQNAFTNGKFFRRHF